MTKAGELNAAVEEILVDESTLAQRVAELGAEISVDYRERDLLLVGVLKGAVFFIADLMRAIDIPCEVDFMAISSYGSATDSSGVVRILKDLDLSIEGRNVLVRYLWTDITPTSAHFEQSFSADGGATWEPSWISTQTRVADDG